MEIEENNEEDEAFQCDQVLLRVNVYSMFCH